MSAGERILRRLKRFFRRGEPGFAMVVVLVALVMISVLGAASLLLMVSTMHGVVNMKPEHRAFLIAEMGANTAHALIVEKGTEVLPFQGEILGGRYEVTVRPKEGSKTDYVVESLGIYQEGGATYRRKIYEEVRYEGEQAFDVLRNYVIFAGRDLTIELSSAENWIPTYIYGNVRANRDLRIYNYATESCDHGFVVFGDVEGGNSIWLESGCKLYFNGDKRYPAGTFYIPNQYCVKGNNILFYGNVRAGLTEDPSTEGTITMKAWSGNSSVYNVKLPVPKYNYNVYNYVSEYIPSSNNEEAGESAIFAAATEPDDADSPWKIQTPTGTVDLQCAADHDKIFLPLDGIEQARNVRPVFLPKPNFDYYKVIAMEQGHYQEASLWNITGEIKKEGMSSMTVYYCTGDMKISGINVNDPNTNCIFVCEGTFTFLNNHDLSVGSTLQVIAGEDIIIDNSAGGSWTEIQTNGYFLYAGRDIYFMFNAFSTSHQDRTNFQLTAVRDIWMIHDSNKYSYPKLSYRAPQIDVGAWPIDITVLEWRELPVDVPPE